MCKCKTINHFYVYYKAKDGNWMFDRTCGTEEAANERVKELAARYPEALWKKNKLLPGAFY
jgi:hypothetical protein